MQQIGASTPFYREREGCVQEGDDFEEFVRTQGSRLRRLAFVLCRDVHRAEDLTQSALAKAYRRWARIGTMENPFAYVSRILVRESISWRRRASAHEVVDGDLAHSGDSSPDHADAVVGTDAMWQLLGQLPPKQRAVLVLRYYLDMPDEQIADALRCSTSTDRSNAARALASLREASENNEREAAHDR
jgi:RNA polymerase sigma-70 factor (sigma-E family)